MRYKVIIQNEPYRRLEINQMCDAEASGNTQARKRRRTEGERIVLYRHPSLPNLLTREDITGYKGILLT